jgi:hypothetical protein
LASLSNAERQRRFRERRKSQLHDDPSEVSRLREENARLRAALRMRSPSAEVAPLTPDQDDQRDLLIGDLLSDRSWTKLPRRTAQPTKFLGMTREGWVSVTPELQEYFGLTKAIETAQRIAQLQLHGHYAAGRRLLRKDWFS